MGWADCGTDSKDRPIGYAFDATCDHKDCSNEIDRGLGYACGGMHGEGTYSCEGYFCGEHLGYIDADDLDFEVCDECRKLFEEDRKKYPPT
ncbi:MAG: hypothetical protein DRH26_01320 [Deltaproteobacteria bacterium]|nr:MAG: hypothetical protein DRH26_01320 [Deltaproteobacteria bacterium]